MLYIVVYFYDKYSKSWDLKYIHCQKAKRKKHLIPSTKTNVETIGNGDLSNYGLKEENYNELN